LKYFAAKILIIPAFLRQNIALQVSSKNKTNQCAHAQLKFYLFSEVVVANLPVIFALVWKSASLREISGVIFLDTMRVIH